MKKEGHEPEEEQAERNPLHIPLRDLILNNLYYPANFQDCHGTYVGPRFISARVKLPPFFGSPKEPMFFKRYIYFTTKEMGSHLLKAELHIDRLL